MNLHCRSSSVSSVALTEFLGSSKCAAMEFPTHVSVNGLSGVPLVLDALRENTHEYSRKCTGEKNTGHLLVSELKWCISQKCRIPRACQRLLSGTELMDDWRSIAAYGNGTEILHINFVACLSDLFTKMDTGYGEESCDALEDLENAVHAFKSKPGVQEEVLSRILKFLNEWPGSSVAMCAFIAWSDLNARDISVAKAFVRDPAIDLFLRLDVIDKLFQSLPAGSYIAVGLFKDVALFALWRVFDDDSVAMLNNAMQSFLLSVQHGNTHALDDVCTSLSHRNIKFREWAVRLFAKLAEEGNPLINTLILKKLACEKSKLFMLKAMARLAGRNFSQVLERMNHAIESGGWIPDCEDRDDDFLHVDSCGHILISVPAVLALRVQKGDTDIISSLLASFLDVDWKVQTLAVEALLQLAPIGCDRSVRALVTLLQRKGQDTEAWVKFAASTRSVPWLATARMTQLGQSVFIWTTKVLGCSAPQCLRYLSWSHHDITLALQHRSHI